ncbi:MAG: hydantoinase B/oxoprolinase family protein [Candidatus Binatia bacterium]
MTTFDPITLEILWNRCRTILNEEIAGLIRAAFSPIIREAKDCSAGLYDSAGNFMTHADEGECHIRQTVKCLLEKFSPEELAPGDVLISNDPWKVGGHINDTAVVVPIFFNGRVAGFTAYLGHHIDMGGRGFSADSTSLYEEGILIPPVKLFSAGEPSLDIFEMVSNNIRHPEVVLSDIRAQMGAAEAAANKIAAMMGEFGLTGLDELSHAMIASSEEATRAAITAIPDGIYRHTVYTDGYDATDPVKMMLTLTIKGSDIIIDYSGSSPQSMYGINLVYNHTLALTHQCLMCTIFPHVRDNEGSYRPLSLIAPEGGIMNAKYPAPVMARHLTGFYIPSAVFGALARVIPDRVVADSAAVSNFGVIGTNERGDPMVGICTCLGGMGARATKDSPTTLFPFVIADIPIEVIENEFPLFVRKREMVQDSGGPGTYRGGLGQEIEVQVRSQKPATFFCMQERINHPPLGFRGGLPGAKADLVINNTIRPHPKKGYMLQPGDTVRIRANGGGGYGPPVRRNPEAVLADVRNEYVSAEQARKVYRVAIDSAGASVDRNMTKRLRARNGARGNGAKTTARPRPRTTQKRSPRGKPQRV